MSINADCIMKIDNISTSKYAIVIAQKVNEKLDSFRKGAYHEY